MAVLPQHLPLQPGNWNPLNDFLSVGHNDDGTVRGPQTVYMAAPSGDTTGVVDTAAATALLNGLSSSGGSIGFLAGTYWLNAQISRAIDNVRVTGAGDNTILKVVAGGTNHVFSLSSRTGWSVTDLKIDLNGSTGTGVNLSASTNCTVERCTITGASTSSQGVQMTSGSVRCAVVNSDISACGKGVTIGGTCLDCEVRGGAIRTSTSTSGSEGGLYAANSARLRVIGVLITGNASSGVYLGDSPDAEIVGCVITSNGGTTAGRRGIMVASSVSAPRLRIIGNYISGNAEQGFYCPTGIVDGAFVANRVVSNNAAAVNPTAGTEFGGSGWTISSNLIAENTGTGCDGVFMGASNYVINGNLIRGNGRRGIYVFGASVNDGTISGNTIKNNGGGTNAPGVEINGSGGTASGHVVNGNRITDDQGGAATQTFGLTTAAVDRVIYDGNNLFPNKTGATSIAGTNVTAGTNIIA